MKRLLLLLPVLLAACDAGTTSPTAPTAAPQFSKGAPTTVQNENTWYANPITWFDQCTPHQWVAGTVNSHVQTQVKFSGGSQRTVSHFNVAGGKLTDVDGGEYVFNDRYALADDYVLEPFTFEGGFTRSFKVISKGRDLNEFFDMTVHYSWDGVTFLITDSYVHNCRGSGS